MGVFNCLENVVYVLIIYNLIVVESGIVLVVDFRFCLVIWIWFKDFKKKNLKE